MRPDRFRSAPALLALVLACGTPQAQAGESPWIDLYAAQHLAGRCPDDFKRVYGRRDPKNLDAAVSILRDRETKIAEGLAPAAERASIPKAMDAYAAQLNQIIDQAVAKSGCTAAFTGLGLDPIPEPDLAAYAREVLIPDSKRPAQLPQVLRTETQAAVSLQRRILLDLAADPRRCEADGADVRRIRTDPVLVRNVPPFVGTPLRYEEAWTLTCAGGRKTFTIAFVQDARRWRKYEIEDQK